MVIHYPSREGDCDFPAEAGEWTCRTREAALAAAAVKTRGEKGESEP